MVENTGYPIGRCFCRKLQCRANIDLWNLAEAHDKQDIEVARAVDCGGPILVELAKCTQAETKALVESGTMSRQRR